jgi:hypothetical protein
MWPAATVVPVRVLFWPAHAGRKRLAQGFLYGPAPVVPVQECCTAVASIAERHCSIFLFPSLIFLHPWYISILCLPFLFNSSLPTPLTSFLFYFSTASPFLRPCPISYTTSLPTFYSYIPVLLSTVYLFPRTALVHQSCHLFYLFLLLYSSPSSYCLHPCPIPRLSSLWAPPPSYILVLFVTCFSGPYLPTPLS